jgi:hypothetical protein
MANFMHAAGAAPDSFCKDTRHLISQLVQGCACASTYIYMDPFVSCLQASLIDLQSSMVAAMHQSIQLLLLCRPVTNVPGSGSPMRASRVFSRELTLVSSIVVPAGG